MKKHLLALLFLLGSVGAFAQAHIAANHTAIVEESFTVTDSEGKLYRYEDWRKLIISGDYNIRRLDPNSGNKEFMLYRYSAAEKAEHLKNMRRPPDSDYFVTGQDLKPFKVTDIYGNTLNPKMWTGKTVVLNFWFVNCQPCRIEIPELNKIAAKYSNNPNVLFIGIALDDDFEIKSFVKRNPFGYLLIPGGRRFADMMKINTFPTNVVIDKEGKVRFHSTGLYNNTAFWIDKTIEESDLGEL